MDKNDLFMHSEQHGAATVIIKNPAGVPVPQLAINEAATFEFLNYAIVLLGTTKCWLKFTGYMLIKFLRHLLQVCSLELVVSLLEEKRKRKKEERETLYLLYISLKT